MTQREQSSLSHVTRKTMRRGLRLVVLPVLAWVGVFQPVGIRAIGAATPWDVILLLVQTIPWVAVLGLILIYAGLKLLGVTLPF